MSARYIVRYPKDVTSDESKLLLLEKLHGELNRRFNEIGKNYKDGKISKEEFHDWKEKIYYKQIDAIHNEMAKIKNQLWSEGYSKFDEVVVSQ